MAQDQEVDFRMQSLHVKLVDEGHVGTFFSLHVARNGDPELSVRLGDEGIVHRRKEYRVEATDFESRFKPHMRNDVIIEDQVFLYAPRDQFAAGTFEQLVGDVRRADPLHLGEWQ